LDSRPHDDGDQTCIAASGCGDDMVSRLLDPPGFEAVRIGVTLQEGIPVVLSNLSIGEVLLRMEVQRFRKAPEVLIGQDQDVPRRGHLTFGGEAVGVF